MSAKITPSVAIAMLISPTIIEFFILVFLWMMSVSLEAGDIGKKRNNNVIEN